jgi:hypothetical protein
MLALMTWLQSTNAPLRLDSFVTKMKNGPTAARRTPGSRKVPWFWPGKSAR